jgi:hypothetical protein
MNVTYSQCLSVSLVIQHIRNMHAPYYSSSAASLAPLYFSTLHERHDVQKNVTEHKICALTFSKSMSKTYLILKRIQ